MIPHENAAWHGRRFRRRFSDIDDERMDYPFDIDGAVVKVNSLSDRDAFWAPRPNSPSGRWPTSTPRRRSTAKVTGHRGPGGAHRRADPQGGAGAGAAGGHHRHQRHPPQPGLHHGKGHPHRRHGAGAEGGGDHPGDRCPWTCRSGPEGAQPYHAARRSARCAARRWCGTRTAPHIRCTGAECPAQLLRQPDPFCQPGCHGHRGPGPGGGGSSWWRRGLVARRRRTSTDLQAEDVAQLERMGKKSRGEPASRAIEKSKASDLGRLLYAFGIRQVGQKAGKVLAQPASAPWTPCPQPQWRS